MKFQQKIFTLKINGTLLIHLRKFYEALQNFIKEVELDSNFAINQTEKGQQFLQQECKKEALKRFNQRLEYCITFNLDNAKNCISLLQKQDALEYLDNVILFKPNDTLAQNLKGTVLESLGQKNEAE
ncbi:hypothetical protein ABPG72_020422 [Tetrahymena utriculariae]